MIIAFTRFRVWVLVCCIPLFASAAPTTTLVHEPLELRPDDAAEHVSPGLKKGSHLRVFLPSLPYLYISHAINGALIRPANNAQGWRYDLATSHRQLSDTLYEFSLRKNVRFQDGTPFNADSVLLNMEYFKQAPFLYSKIHEVFDHAEKIDDYTVRFHLKQKYGVFMNDVVWMQFYTPAYLEKFGWNGKATCPNLAEPGPYGIGPYRLIEGYIEGDRQTAKAELVANPDYWDPRYPRIERVTVYTELDSDEAREQVLYEEGQLDIAPIDFDYKVETLLSPYAKLMISPSTDNYAIHINMRNGNPALLKTEVRHALNEALHQKNLLHFVFDQEGELSPTQASPNFPGVRAAMEHIKPYSELNDPYEPEHQQRLQSILDGLELKVLTQERFLFLWRGIEYQLNKVGVTLDIEVTPSEKEIFTQLLSTNARKNTKFWDFLIWGNDDWFFYHPWTAFFTYRTHNAWSTVYPDPIMDGYIEDMFKMGVGDPGYNEVVQRIMQRAYDEAYMLFVPTPNKVLAVNKEVVFTPYQQAVLPLWEIQLSDRHASVRDGPYPDALKHPVNIIRHNTD
jgi:peptide/nickel transport system substrate-binding protein